MGSIKKLYFNPTLSGSYSGLKSFYTNRHLKIPISQVEKELLKLKEFYLYRKSIKKFPKRQILVFLPNWLITFDLKDVQQYSKENRGYRYILFCMDAFTRKLYIECIKDKTAPRIIAAFKLIFKRMLTTPRYAYSDSGSEFTSKLFQQYLKSKEIIWYSTFGHAPMIERVISTIFSKLIRVFAHKNSNHFLKDLPMLVKSYNNTKHSSTGFAPNEINSKNQFQVVRNLYKNLLEGKTQKKPALFQVNDRVRIALQKDTFEKGYFPRWSLEVFTITRVKNTIPYTYVIKDANGEEIRGILYEQEMIPAFEEPGISKTA